MTQNSMQAVAYEVLEQGNNKNVALVWMQNPPVNALSKSVRVGLIAAIEQALSDDSVAAIVISSKQTLFSGGADISEFSGGDFEPPLPKVLDLIENASKPVIAVLNGPAFGGGLEVALSCHYRVTFAANKVGLPEVNLGILPGAGGTQRLPRLAGVAQALDMIVSGRPVAAKKLPGVFDLVVEQAESLLNEAMAFCNKVINDGAIIKRTSEVTIDPNTAPAELFTQYRQGIAKQARGFFAPERCIQAVEAAVSLPFLQGLDREGELFMECMASKEARAQQHFFFAERAASHVKDYDKTTPTRDIRKVGIIGAGTMGGGIAMNFANAGIPVTMLELKQDALDKGLALIRKNYENSAKKGKLSLAQVEERMALLGGSTSYDDLSDVDLVIEAVFEKMSVKQEVFKSLDAVCKPGAILASNTSTLDLDEIAAATTRPQDVIGLHFFSPANVMKLLEVVKGEKTSADVIKTTMMMAKKINKVAVLVGVCFGFVGNRMIESYGREANRLMLEGANPEHVDKVIYDFGMPMGPFTMGDMAGQDIGYFVRQSRQEFIKHDPSYCVIADRLVEQGRVGLKAGKGAYLYAEGSRVPIPDPAVTAIAKQEAERLGVEQRNISDQEILERIIFPLINEGALILEEGIAAKSSDIDVIYVYGYGFPVYRGGPMQYADEIGLKTVYDAMCKYRDELGEHGKNWFKPAPLLKKLAEQGKRFSDL
ncbi:3-hydroxyacyl-CoA dehydrogenase NAD-binding domain-containing protein [Paraglaciecola sp.]|uniref:3-hydroxyacyl-CoA dehydrogenase NAD-binding domain-containing protein n=1 Tax=Paraglaciecola sp. TaxID=1920173 RepID=UPI00273F5BEF|nr:3-hydroxyacyl-CoA dehydrogenase NAD-binding domain-containing protein [Paraglaciecola sp.]MDP5031081.1 3-hydroxyacyl-CoA dehydrogenase NAD-binding domain-containing protein [Paraglaciecola sp.]MDP5040104.1 3-hydroxyacyl-CoA dehydrogenase NAD-binding domain-containing protein [Paraglaciecola sp.]